jgi:DNA-binding NarL/FixJ family response regulator
MGILEQTSIVLYCQHPILSLGLTNLFQTCADLRVYTVSRIEEAIELAEGIRPDIVVLDSNSGLDLELLRTIKRAAPETKLVLWIDSISTELAFQAFNMGVRGILWKTLGGDDFLQHLREVQKGQLRIEKELMNSIAGAKTIKLTKRESELVSLVAQGLKNKEIATELTITENTVKAYLSRLFQKLNVKDRLDLALYGLKNLAQPSQVQRSFPLTPHPAGIDPSGIHPAAINHRSPSHGSVLLWHKG